MGKIRIQCPGCGKKMAVPEDKVGKRGKCPACGAMIEIGAPESVEEERVPWMLLFFICVPGCLLLGAVIGYYTRPRSPQALREAAQASLEVARADAERIVAEAREEAKRIASEAHKKRMHSELAGAYKGDPYGKVVEEGGSGWTPLHRAANRGNLSEVKRLLAAGADVDASAEVLGMTGMTPLHLAADGGHTAVVRALLEGEAGADASNSRGWTPMSVAEYYGHSEIVELLKTWAGGRRERESGAAVDGPAARVAAMSRDQSPDSDHHDDSSRGMPKSPHEQPSSTLAFDAIVKKLRRLFNGYKQKQSGEGITSARRDSLEEGYEKERDTYIDGLKGIRVEWHGWVSDVSKDYSDRYSVRVQMGDSYQPDRYSWDLPTVTLRLHKDRSEVALQLEKGRFLTFRGTLVDVRSLSGPLPFGGWQGPKLFLEDVYIVEHVAAPQNHAAPK